MWPSSKMGMSITLNLIKPDSFGTGRSNELVGDRCNLVLPTSYILPFPFAPGENVLATLQSLANSQHVVEGSGAEGDPLVFYDIFGLFVVFYSVSVGVVLNGSVFLTAVAYGLVRSESLVVPTDCQPNQTVWISRESGQECPAGDSCPSAGRGSDGSDVVLLRRDCRPSGIGAVLVQPPLPAHPPLRPSLSGSVRWTPQYRRTSSVPRCQ